MSCGRGHAYASIGLISDEGLTHPGLTNDFPLDDICALVPFLSCAPAPCASYGYRVFDRAFLCELPPILQESLRRRL